MRLSSTGKNPCGPLAGIRDRDRRPCEGSSQASATQPVVSARAASRQSRDADVRSGWSTFCLDTLCAIRERGPAFIPNGCAMISRSVGQRVESFLSRRAAERTTPMTGIDRTNLSYRTILILFLLLGAPMAARSAALEDSARELGRKIAEALPAGAEIFYETRNLSSLMPEELARIDQALQGELQSRGIRASANSGGTSRVVVTLSENLKSFVWTAEIHQGDASRVVLVAVTRSLADRIVSDSMPVTLHSEKFWEGSERVVDATIANASNGDPLLLLLTQDGLQIRKVGSDAISIVQIPLGEFRTRDPHGAITQTENGITVTSVPRVCSVDLDGRVLIECHKIIEGPPGGRVFENLSLRLLAMPGPMRVERGSQVTAIQSSCWGGQLYLAAGTGDYTEPDTIQLFESTDVHGIIVERWLSDLLHFSGPVIDLQSAGASPRAIVHNLLTGNYEAHRISITCGG
jgi:hypothetical protein